jgi:hypothetical protein
MTSISREEYLRLMDKKKSATPSEAVTWKLIGVPDRLCRGCGRKLLLAEVAHFGTDYTSDEPVRFVECGECMRLRPAE